MGGDTDVYTFPVFAMPYVPNGGEEDNEPAAPLPEWFGDILRGDGAHYRTFLDGASQTGDWGLAADVARHRAHSERINALLAAREGLNVSLAHAREQRDLAEYRLAAARAPRLLNEYEPLAHMAGAVQCNEGAIRFARSTRGSE
jgi:hypothetical protein